MPLASLEQAAHGLGIHMSKEGKEDVGGELFGADVPG